MERIQLGGFQCFPDESNDSVAYRAELHGNSGANSSKLLAIIDQWITEGVAIPVQALFFNVDKECALAIGSLATPELCPSPTTPPPATTALETTDDRPTAINGTTLILVIIVVVLAIALIVAIIIIIAIVYTVRSRRAAYKFQTETK